MYQSFGRVVAVLRAERRDEDGLAWTQERLGEATGLGVHIIQKIEQGKRAPDPDVMSRLSDALQLPQPKSTSLPACRKAATCHFTETDLHYPSPTARGDLTLCATQVY